MFLAVDIGNTSIKFGLFDGDRLASTRVIPTVRDQTSADIAAAVGEWLPKGLTDAIISSVVPELDAAISDSLSPHTTASFVKTSDDFGLRFNSAIDEAGTDRLVNSFAASQLCGVPCIVIAFGTATTVDVVSGEREHLGGLIAPGPATTAKALELAASKLPQVRTVQPTGVINTNTVEAIQAGIFYSQVGLIEQVVPKIQQQIGDDARVVATGGFAQLIAPSCPSIDTVEPDLTLIGIKMLYSRR